MSYDAASEHLEQDLKNASQHAETLLSEIAKVIVGQKPLMQRLLMALVAEGHVLLEGLPGLAKTSSIKALADTTHLDFSRLQFTPDLLPADLIGTQIYNPKDMSFQVKKGPIFANLVLADEINRAPAKVQSALLEAMQERQVTIGDETFHLPRPFLVLATQNPIEQEGTYPLPEAQVDRFLFKVIVKYGSLEEEQEIVKRALQPEQVDLQEVIKSEDIANMRDLAKKLHVADKVRKYIVELVFATRDPEAYGIKDCAGLIDVGASPRASIALETAARIQAMMLGRTYVTPQDIKDVGPDVLRHRILPSYEAEAASVSTDDLVERIFSQVDVP